MNCGRGRHHHALRIVIAVLLVLLPPVLALAFVRATSSPQDANVGAALYLALGILMGVVLAAVYLARSSR